MATTPALMVEILETVIAPVFIIIAIGSLIERLTSIEDRSLSEIILYVFTPCLVFTSIIQSSLGERVWVSIALIATVTLIVMMSVSWSIGRALRLDQKSMSAFILATSLVNTGNIGLSVNVLAFGQTGLALAVIYYVVSSVLSYTIGVFVASHGTQGLRESLGSVARLPHIYAVVVAFVVKFLGIGVPDPIYQPVNLIAQATIPAMLVVLGMELVKPVQHPHSVNWSLVGLSSAIKLLFPIVPVLLLSSLIGLSGLARDVTLVQACMPTAILAVIFTVKFKGNSQFVTNAILVATLASVATITLILSFLL
ncbi:MAG: AEC family transporter [Candidatus Bathyarchaeia archaeon]